MRPEGAQENRQTKCRSGISSALSGRIHMAILVTRGLHPGLYSVADLRLFALVSVQTKIRA
ncbi:MAG: hypothetical protein B6245_21935 [Desulfobacteraceae bacterium 4572_88]|nr:MAG: hypothetical protein B6245_21935 [Desulfobacteraceae bacterium 4572_88]